MANHKAAGKQWMLEKKIPTLTLESKCTIDGREYTARELCTVTKINPNAFGAIRLAYSSLTAGGAKITWLE